MQSKGRRGLGFELPGMEAEDIDWEQEKVSVSQAAEWFPSCQEPLLSAQELQDTIEIGSVRICKLICPIFTYIFIFFLRDYILV